MIILKSILTYFYSSRNGTELICQIHFCPTQDHDQSSQLDKGPLGQGGRRWRRRRTTTHRHESLRFGFVQLKLQFLLVVIDSIEPLGPGLRYSALEF